MIDIKTKLRNDYLIKLRDLSTDKRMRINQELQKSLFHHELWLNSDTIGITISQNHEWDTWPIIERAWHEGKTVVVPKCEPKFKEMTFYQIDSREDLAVQFFNLLEPIIEKTNKIAKSKIDLLVVPGLVFDHYHYRIGHGGGYYDRFLTDFNQETVALVWKGQLIEKINIESFDQPIKELIIADV
ncbi:5-formyltetrahydrofolate cyclo-ligase [Amphibacillus sp. MSJ-3]|uniref:5-formyltetrahydrofolate cyclo-ligase n=1 Tax=Amphibacillus sp. MSJ-3 TaxID=2841505 RepID=UPI001C0F2DA3|nr:5-formyltetrahydrofolate cyclo-ligase [Amphibacillus sp. MSJ-3]MBU5594767.1 5-formyltetrahydrofolate cyclo-ligase [Amphibacillus sp. MSJ-3]